MRPTPRTVIGTLAVALGLVWAGPPWPVTRAAEAVEPSEERAWQALRDGAVVLFRHANAPGVGDPPGFTLEDCSTQRNLDDTGREQARGIGHRFTERSIRVGAVLTSQWCRTRETAALAFPGSGRVRDEPAFNSFFGEPDRRSPQTARAREIVVGWRGPGALVITTHQVNITALTGVATSSADGIVVRPGTTEVVGRIRVQ